MKSMIELDGSFGEGGGQHARAGAGEHERDDGLPVRDLDGDRRLEAGRSHRLEVRVADRRLKVRHRERYLSR